MADIRVLTEQDLRQVVGFGQQELTAIESVYPIISAGHASMPPIMRIEVPESNGEIDIKSAYLPGYDGIAVKVSAGFFDNPKLGIPSLGGLMIVLDATTGVPTAALFDNGYLTDLRTGLAGAVAARHLATPDASRVTVFGAGVQARFQLEAIALVVDLSEVRVWARDTDKAKDFARSMSGILGKTVEAVADRATAASMSDIIITATPSESPLVTVAMLHPGLHITAVGSDAETKQELDSAVLGACDAFVCDSTPQSVRLGELRAAVADGFAREDAIELGMVIDGATPGRRSPTDVTVCDLTGTGAQDTAIASLAVARAKATGAGMVIDT